MEIRERALRMKQVCPHMAASGEELRNAALRAVSDAITEHKAEILEANEADLAAAKEKGIPAPVLKRLKFDDAKIQDVQSGIEELIGLPDPLDRIHFRREMDEGLILERRTVPIGVIGVIFEARPDAMVQVSTLCLKSGNCAVLKGGSEAKNTNRKLFSVIYDAAVAAGLPEGCMMLAETHDDIDELLKCDDAIDLLIPRGSNEFVKHIMDNTKIPVMGHADGICHIYVDAAADIDLAVPVILDAKTQYPAACNAAETLLVHRDIADRLLPAVQETFRANQVELRGTEDVQAIVDCVPAEEEDFHTEYLDHIISAKIVDSLEEAIDHINKYGSHHTDAIITDDDEAAERFMQLVDSAGVYRNCSTRFADGFRYGFGAEVGISTGKIHARGPVGLEGLVTYKYRIYGSGQIVGDYASGKKSFHFKELM
ncbi:MAG: glutamate-5-semialdehyde dehydrogenase [Firmicutes bacterium]|nr:glutamate-5-semialdehyde dehydrogenase [Bacillota bacterium]